MTQSKLILFIILFFHLSFGAEKKPKIKKVIPKKQFITGEITLKGKRFGNEQGFVFLETNATKLPITSWSPKAIKVKLPQGLALGDHNITICRQDDICSSNKQLEIIELKLRKILHLCLGGIALFFLGLTLLKLGFKNFGFFRLKNKIRKYTKNSISLIGSSIVLSFLLQSSSSLSNYAMLLLEMEMIPLGNLLLHSLGANIGASFIGFLLHFNIVQNSLFLIVFALLAHFFLKKRKDLSSIIYGLLGFGLILYGVHLIKNGFAPLSEHPNTESFLLYFQNIKWFSYFILGFLGALCTILFQSSSLVLLFIISMTQTSGALTYNAALAILCGTPLGVSIQLLWSSRSKNIPCKKLAVHHLFLHLLPWIGFGLFFNPLTSFFQTIIPGSASEQDLSSKIIYPYMALHISFSFFYYNLFILLIGLINSSFLIKWINTFAWKKIWTPDLKIEGTPLQNPIHFQENPKEELLKLQKLILELSKYTLTTFHTIKDRKKESLFFQQHNEIKRFQVSLQNHLQKIKAHSSSPKHQKILNSWLSFLFEIQKINGLFLLMNKVERDIFEIPGDDFQKDAKRKHDMQKHVEHFFEFLTLIIQDPEAQDISESQFFEIEINRTEHRAHRKILSAIGVGEIDSLAGELYLKSFSLHEQIGNALYRTSLDLLKNKIGSL